MSSPEPLFYCVTCDLITKASTCPDCGEETQELCQKCGEDIENCDCLEGEASDD